MIFALFTPANRHKKREDSVLTKLIALQSAHWPHSLRPVAAKYMRL
jgi:hypothetical protein